MIDALKTLYKGEKTFSRQLALFSICGIIGLFNAYLALEKLSLTEVSIIQKSVFLVLWSLFTWFIIGYETLFLHERHIPEMDMRSLKIVFSKTLFPIFLFALPFPIVVLFFPEYSNAAFFVEICLTVPLTMLQAGFSYNFLDNDAGMLFEKFGIKEYFTLIFKRLWMIILAYAVTYFLIFMIFFVFGLIIVLMYHGELNSIGMLISSQQTVILKLTNFILSIFLMYFLTIGTLVWDYELIKTYEK